MPLLPAPSSNASRKSLSEALAIIRSTSSRALTREQMKDVERFLFNRGGGFEVAVDDIKQVLGLIGKRQLGILRSGAVRPSTQSGVGSPVPDAIGGFVPDQNLSLSSPSFSRSTATSAPKDLAIGSSLISDKALISATHKPKDTFAAVMGRPETEYEKRSRRKGTLENGVLRVDLATKRRLNDKQLQYVRDALFTFGDMDHVRPEHIHYVLKLAQEGRFKELRAITYPGRESVVDVRTGKPALDGVKAGSPYSYQVKLDYTKPRETFVPGGHALSKEYRGVPDPTPEERRQESAALQRKAARITLRAAGMAVPPQFQENPQDIKAIQRYQAREKAREAP